MNGMTAMAKETIGRSQNTVPIASTQVAIKGIVQYSTRSESREKKSRE